MRILKLTIVLLLAGVLQTQAQEKNTDFMGMQVDDSNQPVVAVSHEKNNYNVTESQVVNTIASPTNLVTDITYYNGKIWVIGYGEYKITAINPENGSVEDEIAIDILRPYGLSYGNGNFYVLDNDNKLIEIIDALSHELVSTIYLNDTGATYPTGLLYANNELWYNDPRGPYPQSSTEDLIYNLSLSGEKNKVNRMSCDFPVGLAFDGNNIWTTDAESKLIHMLDTTNFNIIKSITAPGGMYPNGLCFDGQYLWLANNASDSIYKIDLGNITTSIVNNDDINNSSLQIYPQPASEYVNIKVSENESIENVVIFDISGKQIMESNNVLQVNNYSIPVSDMTNGIYICKVKTNKNYYQQKIVIKK